MKAFCANNIGRLHCYHATIFNIFQIPTKNLLTLDEDIISKERDSKGNAAKQRGSDLYGSGRAALLGCFRVRKYNCGRGRGRWACGQRGRFSPCKSIVTVIEASDNRNSSSRSLCTSLALRIQSGGMHICWEVLMFRLLINKSEALSCFQFYAGAAGAANSSSLYFHSYTGVTGSSLMYCLPLHTTLSKTISNLSRSITL